MHGRLILTHEANMIHATWRPNETLEITSPELNQPIVIEVHNLRTGGALISIDDRQGYRILERREDVEKRCSQQLKGGLSR